MEFELEYGVSDSIVVPMRKAGSDDLAVTGDWTPATGDVKISKDAGSVANITTLPVIVAGTGSILWKFTLSATEAQAKRIVIQVVDAATKTVDDNVFVITTYGNASAQHKLNRNVAEVAADIKKWLTVAPSVLISGRVDSSVGNMAANVLNAAAIAANAIVAAKIGANAIGASQLATDAVNEIRDSILSDAIKFPGGAITEARLSELDEATGGKMANQVDLIKTETDKIPSIKTKTDSLAFTGGNVHSHTKAQDNLALTAQQKLDVNTEADTALSDIDLDHLSKIAAAPTPTIGSNLDKILNKDGSQTFSQTTDSLEAISDTGGGGLSKQDVANAFMDQNIHGTTPTDDSIYRRFFGERKTATGGSFDERSGIVSGNITKALNPDMGAIFSSMADAAPDIYYGPDLIGKVIVNDQPDTTAQKRNYLIHGCYFFTKTGGVVSKVSGIAKKMGVTNGAGQTAGGLSVAGWAGDVDEGAATGDGWTFIVEALPSSPGDFPNSNHDLHLEMPSHIVNLQASIEELMGTASIDAIADAVWNELKGGHVAAGSFGKSVGDIETDTNEIQGKLPDNKIMGSGVTTDKDDEIDAIKAKTNLLPADPASETNVNANETKIDALQTDVTAVKAKTDLLPADPASETNVNANETKIDALQTDSTAIKAKTDLLAFTSGNVNSHTKAQDDLALTAQQKLDVNAEALDVVNVDTISELPSGAPPKNPTMREAQMLDYMRRRNKQIVDSNTGEEQIFNDADGKIAEGDITDSGGIFTKQKLRAPN